MHQPPAPLTPNAPIWEKFLIMLSSWLVPGAGYAIKGDFVLGAINFVLLQGSFLVGLFVLNGAVIWPEFSNQSAEFSVINILIWAGQLFNGLLGGIASLGFTQDPEFLGADPASWKADLGAFYMLVGGAMNLFVMLGIWDRYYSKQEPALLEEEADKPESNLKQTQKKKGAAV